jgi:putative transport protein
MFEIRTFRVNSNSIAAGRSVNAIEHMIRGARIYIDRIRRNGKIEKPEPGFVLRAGDVIGIAGRHEILIDHADKFGIEVADCDLVQGSIDAVDVVVTKKKIDGMSLVELGNEPFARGVFLRGISRSGIALPVMPATIVERGDVLSIVGAPEATKLAVDAIGLPDRVTDVTDMAFVGLGIVIGAIVGIPAIRFGALDVGLSQSVGVLLGGIVFGWLRAIRPVFGRIPSPTLWLFESLGLTGFVAVVGLAAGPDFVRGLQESGLSLVFAAMAVVISALFATLMVGHFVFRMHPGILVGACAGACTATPALAAVQEAAKSSVPTLGYGVSYAVGNVLLALGGKVIVILLA